MKKTKEIITVINKFDEIPDEVLELLRVDLKLNNMTIDDLKEINDDLEHLIYYIREGGDYEETLDSSYITKTYRLDLNDVFSFEAVGNSYRKDGCICEMEMDESISLIKKVKIDVQKSDDTVDWSLFLSDLDINISESDKIKLIEKLKTLKLKK